MKTNNVKPGQGKILISEPFLNDYYFHRSVILLADHNKDGSFGLILNKPIQMKFNEVVQDFPDFKADIFFGGPVKTDSLFFTHTLGDQIANSVKIIDGIYWGGNIKVVHELIKTNKISPDQIRFYLGYSGWGPKQLENELKENSWVVSTAKAEQLMDIASENLWKSIVETLGKDYIQWINYPSDPTLN